MIAAPMLSDRGPNTAVRTDFPRNGRIQTRVRRLLIIHGPMTTGDIARQIYARPTTDSNRLQVRRAARKFALEIGRRRSRGVPIIWKLRGP